MNTINETERTDTTRARGYTFRRVSAGLHEIRGTDYQLRRNDYALRRPRKVWDLYRGEELVESSIHTVKDASRCVRFVEEVEHHLRELGAVKNTEKWGRMYPWNLETSLSLLRISVNGHWVAMRFDDVERASMKLTRDYHGLNTYSGKWNFHPSRECDVEDVLRGFKHMLAGVME